MHYINPTAEERYPVVTGSKTTNTQQTTATPLSSMVTRCVLYVTNDKLEAEGSECIERPACSLIKSQSYPTCLVSLMKRVANTRTAPRHNDRSHGVSLRGMRQHPPNSFVESPCLLSGNAACEECIFKHGSHTRN